MSWLVRTLRENSEVSFFLVLALGYGLGNFRVGKFKLGPVLGVLIAGIAVGQLAIPVSELLKNSLFMLFLFAIGYQTGPQFFHSLRMTGPKQIILTLVVCATALGLTIAVVWLLSFDAGKAAGLLAGAMTGSAAFGAATEAISGLSVPEAQRQTLLTNAGVAFAVCYLIGTVGVIWILTKLGPWIMRVDLPVSCKELERQMGEPDEELIASRPDAVFETRTHRVPRSLQGRTITEVEDQFKPYRVFIEGVRRDSKIHRPDPAEVLSAEDVIVLWGRREALLNATQVHLGVETYDPELLNIGVTEREIVLTNPSARNLAEFASNEITRGIFLERIQRGGKDLPFTLQTTLEGGDVLSVRGVEAHIAQLAEAVGYQRQQSDASNMTNIAAAIFIGAAIGLPAIGIAGVKVTLTTFVGVLIGGLALGRLSSINPRFGGIPGPALWLMDSFGLCGFLALVGMQAGPGFVNGLKQSGFALVASALIVVLLTHVVGILVGRYILRMHPAIVLGACAGAGTSAPALGALIESSNSRVATLSYGVGYALGNVMLAVGASLIVRMVGQS